MKKQYWLSLSLIKRVQLLRYSLPPVLVLFVLIYQLQVALPLEEAFGHFAHYSVEIAFYSLVGPAVTWLTLTWIERRLIEQDALERQVHAHSQQLASLTDSSADAILRLDHSGHVTSWNKGAYQLFGYTDKEMIGAGLEKIIPDTAKLAQRLKRDGLVNNFETQALTKDRLSVTVDLTQTVLIEESEGVTVSLIIIRDITAQRERAAILDEERNRIARDLHDGIAQSLYFMALKADMTRQQLSKEPKQAATNLKEISKEARNMIRDVRRAIFGLKPLEWEEDNFLPALRQFIKEFVEQMDWQLNTQIPDELYTPPRHAPTIFRIIQESLNNIAKHAEAKHITIHIQKIDQPSQLKLFIADDGIGFDPDIVKRGLGLSQMQKRVAAAGGHFSIKSQPGTGTEVRIDLPFRRRKK